MTMFTDVGAFHQKFGIPYVGDGRGAAHWLTSDVLFYRANFLLEELVELGQAVTRNDLPGAADAIIDFGYVAYGTGHLMNIALPALKQRSRGGAPPRLLDYDMMLSAFNLAVKLPMAAMLGYVGGGKLTAGMFLENMIEHVVGEMATEMNLPVEALWNVVHEANMAKERGATDKRGHQLDVRKPPDWRPPDIEGVLRAHGWEDE